jgi:hypothetical protein
MEALRSSETSILTETTRRNIPEDGTLHSHRRECLRSYNYTYEGRPQSKFPTRPTGSKPYITRSDCVYMIEQ